MGKIIQIKAGAPGAELTIEQYRALVDLLKQAKGYEYVIEAHIRFDTIPQLMQTPFKMETKELVLTNTNIKQQKRKRGRPAKTKKVPISVKGKTKMVPVA